MLKQLWKFSAPVQFCLNSLFCSKYFVQDCRKTAETEKNPEIIYFQIKNQKVYNQNISICNTSKYIKVYTIYSLW